MAYDVTVGLANGVIRTFNGITKIESLYFNGLLEKVWKEVENPLNFDFDVFGDYRFSNKSTTVTIHTQESSYLTGIVFVEVKRTITPIIKQKGECK